MNPPKEYTIEELLQEIRNNDIKFKIPGYQRGYKWTKTQADQLIDDLISYGNQQKLIGSDNSYQTQNQKSASAYYLQPISVCPSDKVNNVNYVIDGQQRLTTIWLLLYACNSKIREKDKLSEKSFFELEYESFADWQKDFTDCVSNSNNFEAFKRKSLNHFHIFEVYDRFINRIGNHWKVNANNKIKAQTIYNILLFNTKIIWSDISSVGATNEDPIRTFTNLNSGKIPLTCGELIKGLVLQENNFRKNTADTDASVKDEDQRLLLAIQELIKSSRESKVLYDKIAREWDEFERELHDESLWHFIYNKETNYIYDTRLEYIFNLIEQTDKRDDPMRSFNNLYDRVIKDAVGEIERFWNNVEKYMATIREWYKDKEYYHLIGYLVATTPWISVKDDEQKNKIIDKTVISYLINGLYGDSWSKSTLRTEIRKLIINSLANDKEDSPESDDGQLDPDILDNLRYKQDNDAICRYLLFFNIHTILMQEGEERFPFNRYKEESWDIEHIASQTDFDLLKKDANEAQLWALHIIQYFTGLKVDNYIEEGRISKGKNTFIGKKVRELSEKDLNELEKDINNSFQDLDSDKKNLCQSLKEYLCGKNDLRQSVQQLGKLGLAATMSGEEKDKIGNLTLLNMSINRGYGNAIFPVKRMTIQDELQKGYFVPPCTQRVFQKAYSRKFDQLYVWNEQDAEAYSASIKEAIQTFNEIEGTYAEYKSTKNNS